MVAYRKTIALSTLLVVVVIHDNNRSLVKEWFEWSAAEVVEAYRQGRPVSFVVFPDSGPPEVHLSRTDKDWFEHVVHECVHVAWFCAPPNEESYAQLIAALSASIAKEIKHAHRQGKVRLSHP